MEQMKRGSVVGHETSVRDRMRERAREQSRGGERGPFRTPEWLDHSFVLPASEPVAEARDVTLPAPRAASSPKPLPVFDRPARPEVDFASVVRRGDAGRRARIATAISLVLALVAVVVFQVTAAPAAAACAILFALVTLGAATTRILLSRAPVPYLEG